MAGRPRKLTKKLTDQILDYLSDGLTIRQVFEKVDYTWTSFRKELVADPELMNRYNFAKELAIIHIECYVSILAIKYNY